MMRSAGKESKAAVSSEAGQVLVSVIIPTYQRSEAVRRAALSALEQTWGTVEVVVVADGPDLATRAALEGLDDRLRYLELPENRGPAAARNAGVCASRGEWIAFLDDDDLMLPNKIEAQMGLADPTHPQQMISCRSIYRRGDRDALWPERPIEAEEDIADYILRRPSLFRRPGIVSIQSLLVHRSLLEAVPFRAHRDHEDWAWLLEAWHLAGARVCFVWEPLVIYCIETESASRSRRLNWSDSLEWAQAHRRWIPDRAFCCFLATKVALKAKRAGDLRALAVITSHVLRNGCGLLDLMFLAGIYMLPRTALHSAWRHSLHSRKEGNQDGLAPVLMNEN